jgi:hypothetical protein
MVAGVSILIGLTVVSCVVAVEVEKELVPAPTLLQQMAGNHVMDRVRKPRLAAKIPVQVNKIK